MKKINLIIPLLKILFSTPSILFKAMYHAVVNEDRKNYTIKKYNLKNGLPQIDILDLFPNLSETIDYYTHLYGTSLPIDMVVLKILAKEYKNCDYLEIGTWRGESIANVSEVAKHCVSISLSDEDMHKIGFDERFTKVQRFFSKGKVNIEHIEANSRTFDFSTLNRKFDLIFVDGDHSYEGVKSDTEKVFDLLKDENSVIVWHDYTTNYEQMDWEVFAGILDGAPIEKRSKIFQISNTLCAIYTNKSLKTKQLNYPTFPDKKFQITIKGIEIKY